MDTEAQKRAKAKYKADKVKKMLLEFYPTDVELFEHLEKQDKKQTYIKNLIREDMNRSK